MTSRRKQRAHQKLRIVLALPMRLQLCSIGHATVRGHRAQFWEHVSARRNNERPCDRECQILGARDDLFDASRRDAPRPCATECEPLARDPTNCRADVSHGRALMRRSDAQTMVPVLGTRVGAQNFETPMAHRVLGTSARNNVSPPSN